jgi:cytochrome c oxidase assembly protein subunit 15
MELFRIFSYLSTGLTYLLIFVGGMVRVSGAGMGCPDWPKCFDRWIPPTHLSQLPDHIDPAKFNIVLAWIEYSNRLFGALVGLTITITLVIAIKYFSHKPTIKWPLIFAFILTLIEGWLGAVLVHTVLNPITITLHLLLALIIVMLLLYAAQESYYIDNPEAEKTSKYPSNIRWVFVVLGLSLFIEIIIGTEIRGGLEILRKDNPLLDSNFLLYMLGPFKYMHTILGIAIFALSIFLWYKLVKKAHNPSELVSQSSFLILFLIFLQIISGEVLVFVKVKPILQLFHLWFASIIMGLISVQYCAWRKSQEHYE